MSNNNEILKNYMGCKAYNHVMTPKLLKSINKSEKDRFLIYNINNFFVGFRENLANGERIELNSKLDYFPQYPLEDYLQYFKSSEFLVEEEGANIFISLRQKESSSKLSFIKKLKK